MLQAIITMEKNDDKVVLELFSEETPVTVENFVKLAKSGFYDGLTFHRVIPDFMSQGGCPNGTGTGGPGYRIPCETHLNVHRHVPGALSMAHAGKNTGGSQFFICHVDCPWLDGVHTVFGQTLEGLEVVKNMRNNDKIKTIEIIEL